MQNQPLLLSSLLQHADRFHSATEIVSRTVEGPIHRHTYSDAARRSRKLADALARWGVTQSDRVATLAWNNFRHFEIEHALAAEPLHGRAGSRDRFDLTHADRSPAC